jgi:hypothetical protein
VAGVAGQDRWQIVPGIDVTYGGRAERFDYLVQPHLFSAHGGLRIQVHPLTAIRFGLAQFMVAPGADEFLPPPSGADWLPAERTFGPLTARRALRAERVRNADVQIVQRLGEGRWSPTLHVRGLHQRTTDQMATIFGVTAAGGAAGGSDYSIAPVGGVDLIGWSVGASAQLSPEISGRIDYTRVLSAWDTSGASPNVRRTGLSLVRPDLERVHDVTASLDARLPRSSTRITVAYRLNSAFSQRSRFEPAGFGARFQVQVEQALPYRPTRTSRIDVVFSIRNLFRDVRSESSWYDELLTVAPPMRFMGGLQVRF